MENNSTFERLLRIQGNPKQLTLDSAVTEARAPAPGKLPADEVETWRALYRFYAKYAPLLREAALLDDNNDRASAVFREASEDLAALHSNGGIIGKALAVPVYGLLEDVCKVARGGS